MTLANADHWVVSHMEFMQSGVLPGNLNINSSTAAQGLFCKRTCREASQRKAGGNVLGEEEDRRQSKVVVFKPGYLEGKDQWPGRKPWPW
jgi:hypothetical protein